jgi:hypothetical protein
MTKRLYDLKSETALLRSEGGLFRHFSGHDWMCDLASCSDATQHMNEPYINLQVANHLVFEMFWQNNRVLRGSDDGVCHSGLVGLWTSPIVPYSKEHRMMDNVQKPNNP